MSRKIPEKAVNVHEREKTELEYAFPRTVPVMAGYLVLGAAYGILMADSGFGTGLVGGPSAWWCTRAAFNIWGCPC